MASVVRTLLRPAKLLAPLNGSDRITPAIGDFYFWASSGSVPLPASRYNYSIDWTPLLAGLAPAGTAASAAPPIATRAGLRLLPAITASPSRGPRRASARRTPLATPHGAKKSLWRLFYFQKHGTGTDLSHLGAEISRQGSQLPHHSSLAQPLYLRLTYLIEV